MIHRVYSTDLCYLFIFCTTHSTVRLFTVRNGDWMKRQAKMWCGERASRDADKSECKSKRRTFSFIFIAQLWEPFASMLYNHEYNNRRERKSNNDNFGGFNDDGKVSRNNFICFQTDDLWLDDYNIIFGFLYQINQRDFDILFALCSFILRKRPNKPHRQPPVGQSVFASWNLICISRWATLSFIVGDAQNIDDGKGRQEAADRHDIVFMTATK